MNKIGVVTLLGRSNYGNRLQNYAVQCILEKYCSKVETIKHRYVATEEQMKIRERIKRFASRGIIDNIGLIANKIKIRFEKTDFKMNQLYKLRADNFELFDNRFIRFASDEIINDQLDSVDDYRAFFVGSDQVWNPDYVNQKDVYFLTFAEPKKRFSIAASFGVGSLSNDVEVQFAEKLSKFQAISVREFSGSALVESLTSNKCLTILDPTLILSPSIWEDVKRMSNDIPDSNYVLTYFIGGNIEEKQLKARKHAAMMGMEVVHLNSVYDEKRFVIGVEEFLGYFYGSSIVLTDSFHGTAFSIIFEKEFYVFEREDSGKSMFSRISTLLETTGIGERNYLTYYDEGDVKSRYQIDFTEVRMILQEEREKAQDFIESCMLV